MQADARLVEDVQHSDQARPNLGRQTNSLPFSPRQRAGRTVERQVVETNVNQEAEALTDLLEDAPGDRGLALRQRETVEEYGRLLDGLPHDLRDRVTRDLDAERLGPQARTPARRARPLGHELLDLGSGLLGRGLAVPALERLDDALEAAVALAVEDHVAHGLAQLGPRCLEGKPVSLRQHLQCLPEVGRLVARPGRQRAVLERASGIRYEPDRVDLVARTEPSALRARAVRVVEREHPRRDLREGDAALRAGQLLRKGDWTGMCCRGGLCSGLCCSGGLCSGVREAGSGRGWPE